MRKFIAIALCLAMLPSITNGQELPKYPIHHDADRMAYDLLASEWDSSSKTARQCALDRIKNRHISKEYNYLLLAYASCLQKELGEQEGSDG